MNIKTLWIAFFVLTSTLPIQAQKTTDIQEIKNLLDEFLSKVAEKKMHDRFWSEELIYTSSSGERFGKSTIMEGFNDDKPNEPTPITEYSAANVNISVFGKSATLTFKLIAQTTDSSAADIVYYYNSGFLKKENKKWEVIVWQATKIPSKTP